MMTSIRTNVGAALHGTALRLTHGPKAGAFQRLDFAMAPDHRVEDSSSDGQSSEALGWRLKARSIPSIAHLPSL
jgi:hypothetical protein